MSEITIVDSSNLGVPAVIFKDGTPVAAANIDGLVNLDNGDYTAKSIGFQDTDFSVNGDKYVLMKEQSYSALNQPVEITAKKTTWKKWVYLGVIGLGLFTLIKILIKK